MRRGFDLRKRRCLDEARFFQDGQAQLDAEVEETNKFRVRETVGKQKVRQTQKKSKRRARRYETNPEMQLVSGVSTNATYRDNDTHKRVNPKFNK